MDDDALFNSFAETVNKDITPTVYAKGRQEITKENQELYQEMKQTRDELAKEYSQKGMEKMRNLMERSLLGKTLDAISVNDAFTKMVASAFSQNTIQANSLMIWAAPHRIGEVSPHDTGDKNIRIKSDDSVEKVAPELIGQIKFDKGLMTLIDKWLSFAKSDREQVFGSAIIRTEQTIEISQGFARLRPAGEKREPVIEVFEIDTGEIAEDE